MNPAVFPVALQVLFALCAPTVSPITLSAIVRTESGGNPHALHINGPAAGLTHSPRNREEAAQVAHRALDAGYSVDLGLMQVNTNTARPFHYSVEQLLDPCTNLAVGSSILTQAYSHTARLYGPGQRALRIALSIYNTGSPRRGIENGYVRRVVRRAPPKSPEFATRTPAPSSVARNAGGQRVRGQW